MKIVKKLALTLGIAAGAFVAVAVSGRTVKKVRPYASKSTQNNACDAQYDEAEAQYI